MATEVRGDSLIRVVDPTGKIKTVIHEEDYERSGYKARGWAVDKTDWTKDRVVRKPVDYTKELNLNSLAQGTRASD